MIIKKKKILVVSRPGDEYVLDLVVHGLYKLEHTVIDFPRKENYKKDSQKHMIGSRLPKHDFDLSKESDFDFCLVGNYEMFFKERGLDSDDTADQLAGYIASNNIPVLAFNTEDFTVDYEETWGRRYGDLVIAEFVREVPKTTESGVYTHNGLRKALQLSFKEELYKGFNEEPDFTCFASFSPHGGVGPARAKRRMVVDYISDMNGCMGYFHDRMKYDSYINMLGNSLSSISVRGGGWDSIRYWEIPGMGCLMISEDVGKKIPIDNDFISEKDSILFDFEFSDSFEEKSPMDFLKGVLNKISSNKDYANTLRKAGHEKVMAYHTTAKRAQFVIDTAVKSL